MSLLHYTFRSLSDEQCEEIAIGPTILAFCGNISKTEIECSTLLIFAYLLWRQRIYKKYEMKAILLRIRGGMAEPDSKYQKVMQKIPPGEFVERLKKGKAAFGFGVEQKRKHDGNDDNRGVDDDEDNDQKMEPRRKQKGKIGKIHQIMNLIIVKG